MARQDSEYENNPQQMEYQEDSWVCKFLSVRENSYLERVPDSYINDRFNLHGLREIVEGFDSAYKTLKQEMPHQDIQSEAKLYFLLHQRYISFTKIGMQGVLDRVLSGEFGYCPRYGCLESKMVPTGLSNDYGKWKMKVYCHSCKNVYEPKGTMKKIDGSAWGTSFAQFLIFSNPYHFKQQVAKVYTPRLFGFKVSRCEIEEESVDE